MSAMIGEHSPVTGESRRRTAAATRSRPVRQRVVRRRVGRSVTCSTARGAAAAACCRPDVRQRAHRGLLPAPGVPQAGDPVAGPARPHRHRATAGARRRGQHGEPRLIGATRPVSHLTPWSAIGRIARLFATPGTAATETPIRLNAVEPCLADGMCGPAAPVVPGSLSVTHQSSSVKDIDDLASYNELKLTQ